jgi:hypothetical protein
MCNTRIQFSKARKLFLLKKQIASNLRDNQENTSNLIYSIKEVGRESKEITDLESLDRAYVVAPN